MRRWRREQRGEGGVGETGRGRFYANADVAHTDGANARAIVCRGLGSGRFVNLVELPPPLLPAFYDQNPPSPTFSFQVPPSLPLLLYLSGLTGIGYAVPTLPLTSPRSCARSLRNLFFFFFSGRELCGAVGQSDGHSAPPSPAPPPPPLLLGRPKGIRRSVPLLH